MYIGHHNDQSVVVREFHFVELDEVEIERMAKVHSFHVARSVFLDDKYS